MYVVTAYRFGNNENHSYVVGVFSSRVQARFNADVEESFRGGKYICEISEFQLDAPIPQEMLDYHYGMYSNGTRYLP
jgi:hypothetical protein